jgi:PAS domain S-box-containing protein
MSDELTILVVEDNPGDLDLILEALSEAGPARFKVKSASRLATALEQLKEGGFDVVLLDLGLPDSQGLDTLRAVVGADLPVPIVVLTGHDDDLRGQAALREGAQDYLVKGTMPIRMLGRFLRFAVERHRARENLRQSEETYRVLFETMVQGVLLLGGGGRILSANSAALAMLGLSMEEILGKTSTDPRWRAIREDGTEFPAEDRPSTVALRTGREVNGVVVGILNPREGRWRWLIVNAVPLFLPGNPNPHRVQVTFEDITERKRSEDEIRNNEERLRSLVSILQHRSESVTEFLDYALDQAIQLTRSKIGYIYHYIEARREFVLSTWSSGVMADCTITKPQSVYGLESTGIWGEAVRQGRPIIVNDFSEPHPLKKGYPEGHAHLRSFMTIPVFSGDDLVAVVGLANKATDYDDKDVLQLTLLMEAVWKVVEQRRSQERIVHLNRVLRAIRDINQLIVRERDPSRLIEEACHLLVETRGYHSALIVLTDQAEIPGFFAEAGIGEAFLPLAERLRSGDLPPCCDQARDISRSYLVTDRADTCASCLLESCFPDHDALCVALRHEGNHYGFMIVSLAFGLGTDEEEQSLFAEMAGDVAFALHATELAQDAKQADERQRLAESKLRQAQKMEALGTLSGGIAHDFNNILGIIMGYAELAGFEAVPGTRLHEFLQEVMKASNRAKDLVTQILAFSRQVAQEKRPVSVGLLVKEALKMLRASIPATIEIRSSVSDKALVNSDPTQIHQVLMNLCTNASHSMREHGGVLDVTVRDVELTGDMIMHSDELEPGPYVELSVTDTGHGIDPAIMDRIFDPFFTTKDLDEGTGLGLAVVHGIVKTYGGAIEVSSTPGRGTAFRILLPAAPTAGPSETREYNLPRGQGRILVVDDESALAEAMKLMLQRLGYAAECQASGVDALETMRHEDVHRPFDLVITDMTMPRMTGLELAGELLLLRPELPVIICTGFSENLSREKVERIGIKGILSKPVTLKDLAVLVREVLDRS